MPKSKVQRMTIGIRSAARLLTLARGAGAVDIPAGIRGEMAALLQGKEVAVKAVLAKLRLS